MELNEWPATPRMHYFTPDELSDRQRVLYDSLASGPRAKATERAHFPLMDKRHRLAGPYNAMLLAPDIGECLDKLGLAVRQQPHLGMRSFALVVLLVAEFWDCDFERFAHSDTARAAGFSADDIEALWSGNPPRFASDAEEAVYDVTMELLTTHSVGDSTYARAAGLMTADGIFSLICLIGHYSMIAGIANVFRLEPPAQ